MCGFWSRSGIATENQHVIVSFFRQKRLTSSCFYRIIRPRRCCKVWQENVGLRAGAMERMGEKQADNQGALLAESPGIIE